MDIEQELTPEEHQFLMALRDKLGGDLSGCASMFDVGETLGLDRAASSRIAENLMALEMVDIRTLAGAIGLTQAAAEIIDTTGGKDAAAGLGPGPVIHDTGLQAVETMTVDLKSRIGDMGLEFERLSELTADLKSIDAQLSSPRPKTAILRACFESIADVLSESGKSDVCERICSLLSA